MKRSTITSRRRKGANFQADERPPYSLKDSKAGHHYGVLIRLKKSPIEGMEHVREQVRWGGSRRPKPDAARART